MYICVWVTHSLADVLYEWPLGAPPQVLLSVVELAPAVLPQLRKERGKDREKEGRTSIYHHRRHGSKRSKFYLMVGGQLGTMAQGYLGVGFSGYFHRYFGIFRLDWNISATYYLILPVP